MPIDRLFAGTDALASAMSAEKLRMTTAAENLANAGSTAPVDGGRPYARQRVVFEEVVDRLGRPAGGVSATVVQSPRYEQRYDPDHPHADPQTGLVTSADIDPILELTDLMIANRAYKADVNAAKGLMRMHEQALSLGGNG
ncbi:MAG: flagellar basal body rod protein FlgC [Planctomycetota bacterium]